MINFLPSGADCLILPIEEFDFPDSEFDLINAQWTLPFIGKEHFSHVFRGIKKSLKTEGYFTGQLYGIKDEWNTPDCMDIVFHTKDQVDVLLEGVRVIQQTEETGVKQNLDRSSKFWHVYHIIFQKGQHHVTSKKHQ